MFIENQNEGGSITYANISNGSIVVKSDSSNPKAVKRLNKKGVEVYEQHFGMIYGVITGLTVSDNIFNETEIRIRLKDVKDENKLAILTIKWDSSYGRDFVKQILNADLSKPIIFQPWTKTYDDKKVTKLYLSYSKGNNVLAKFPDGTPEVKFIETKKGPQVDTVSKIANEEFLLEKVNEFIKANSLTMEAKDTSYSLSEDVDTTPLTKEDMEILTKSKRSKKGEAVEETDSDDFFADL